MSRDELEASVRAGSFVAEDTLEVLPTEQVVEGTHREVNLMKGFRVFEEVPRSEAASISSLKAATRSARMLRKASGDTRGLVYTRTRSRLSCSACSLHCSMFAESGRKRANRKERQTVRNGLRGPHHDVSMSTSHTS